MVSLPAGSRLGRYQVIERAGRGGMAAVFRALDPELGRNVAVKVLPSFQTEDPTFVGRFRQEAQLVAGLNHPHIVQVYDSGEDKGFNFIVMEYAGGGTLQNLAGRQLDLTEALPLIIPMAEALDYAHGQGVIHRDIKPANVLLDADGKVKISDFGLARLIEANSGFTRSDTVMGTPEYMSPEQALGRSADVKSDLYAFGVLLYQMLVGQIPFRADTPTATLMAHIHQSVPLPTSLDPGLDTHVESVLLRALAKEPDDRYENASQMATELAGVAGETEERIEIDSTPDSIPLVAAPATLQETVPQKTDADPSEAVPPTVAAGPRPTARKVRISDYCLVQDVKGADGPTFSPKLLAMFPLFLLDKKGHFTGLRGFLWRRLGVNRGPFNPNICTTCDYHFHSRKLSEVTVLIADSEDLSAMVRNRGPQVAASVVDDFLKMCTDFVVNHDGMVIRHGAHGVMAVFNAPIRNIDHVDQAIATATEIQLAGSRVKVGDADEGRLRVGISIDTGLAYAGSLGSDDPGDYSVLGDVVDIASDLQQQIDSGGILVTEQVYQEIASAYPNAEKRVFPLKGNSEPVIAYWLG